MFRDGADQTRIGPPAGWKARLASSGSVAAVAVIVYAIGLRITQFYGFPGLTVFFAAVFVFAVMAIVSVQRIEIAVLVWVVSVSGFRGSLLVDLPGLPDVTPDRILLIWLICVAALRSLARPQRAAPPLLPDFLVIAHTLYLLGSCLIANPLAFNMWTRSYLMPAAGYFFGKYILCEPRWFQRLAYLLVVINLYMGFTSVAQHFGWNSLVWPQNIITSREYIGRSIGIFIQPGVLVTFLGMVLPFQFYLHVTARSLFWRWFHLAGALLCIAGMYFTYTRGGWIATGVGLVLMAFLGRQTYLRRFAIYGVVIALVMGLGVLSVKQDAFLQKRLNTESTIEGRINVWATSYFMWQSHPILGIGFKRFNDFAGNYRETLEVPIYGLIKANIDPNSSPHDIFVSVLAEEGILGAGLQAGIYLVVFRALLLTYRSRRKQGDVISAYMLPPVGATLVTYVIGGASFDYRFFESLNSHFYLFAGILIAWSTSRISSLPTAKVTSV